jgi:hypothetical protein
MTTRVFTVTADATSDAQVLDAPSLVAQITGTDFGEVIRIQASDDGTNWADVTPDALFRDGRMRGFLASLLLPDGYRVRVVSSLCHPSTSIRVAIT